MKKNIVLAITFGLTACGGGGSDSGGGSSTPNQTAPAVFTVDPVNGPNCVNPTKTSDFSSGGYESKTCTWFCSPNFDGQQNVYVSIDFSRRNGESWSLESKYVSDGICP